MTEFNIENFLKTIVIPGILKTTNLKLIESSFELLKSDTIIFTKLYLLNLKCESKNIKIILKFAQSSGLVEVLPMKEFYQNEVTFYKKYLPYATKSNSEFQKIVPKFYSGQVDCVNSPDYIAIEFLNNYRLAEKIFLPKDHIEMSLEYLGNFHGMNYTIKETERKQFDLFCKQFVETRFKDFSFDQQRMLFELYINAAMIRGFQYVPNLNRFPDEMIKQFQNMFQGSHKMGQNLVRTKNETAILCHGDFNRNNLMFEYTDNNELKSVKVIDFQTVRYASPAIDLSLFLSMNVHYELLEQNFDEFFILYHSAVIQTIKKYSPNTDLRKYSMDVFLKDYAEHAIYGYSMIVFFIEYMENPTANYFSDDSEYYKCDTMEAMQNYVNNRDVSNNILTHQGHILNHCLSLYEKYCFK